MDVKTYLNSGNLVFSSDVQASKTLCDQIEFMISQKFGMAVHVPLLEQEAAQEILRAGLVGQR